MYTQMFSAHVSIGNNISGLANIFCMFLFKSMRLSGKLCQTALQISHGSLWIPPLEKTTHRMLLHIRQESKLLRSQQLKSYLWERIFPFSHAIHLATLFGDWTPQNSMTETTGQASPIEPVEILLQQETVSVNVVAPVTESPRTQRKLCFETLKNIQNSLYIVDDPAILYQVDTSLIDISGLLEKNTPKLCSLPL